MRSIDAQLYSVTGAVHHSDLQSATVVCSYLDVTKQWPLQGSCTENPVKLTKITSVKPSRIVIKSVTSTLEVDMTGPLAQVVLESTSSSTLVQLPLVDNRVTLPVNMELGPHTFRNELMKSLGSDLIIVDACSFSEVQVYPTSKETLVHMRADCP